MTDTGGKDAPLDEDQAVSFLLDLARALHLAYVPSIAVEARVRQAARAWGFEVEVFTLQSLVLTQVVSGARRRVDFERLPFNPHWNLGRAAEMLLLSNAVSAGELRLPEARARLDHILATNPPNPEWLVFLAYGVYGAAVAARVGGAWLEMGVGFVVGVLAGFIHFRTLLSMRVDLQKSFLATFLGTLVAFGLTLVLPPFDAPRALFGGVTLLVPAMVLTLGSFELVVESVEAGLPRFSYGVLRFLLMGAGIVAAGKLWGLFLPLPPLLEAHPLPPAVLLAIVAVGGVALTVCMSARRYELAFIVGAVLLAYGTQELTKITWGDKGSPLVSAFVLGIAGQLYGRIPGRLPSTVIMPGLLQLAPGFLGTETVLVLLGAGGTARFFDVLLVALQIVLGLIVAAVMNLSGTPRPGRAPEGSRGRST